MKTIKRADILIILVVLVLCAGTLAGFLYLRGDAEGDYVVVYSQGSTYGTYSLGRNQTIKINNTNVLRIEDGEAYMESADCPDQICVNEGHISEPGQLIVCLPNLIVVEVISNGTDEG
ncbi:MAG: NusG domain II-containing protein [Clostridiales bacterium]|nr:NusG domain II-containing protein [Clostridiales bacterium]